MARITKPGIRYFSHDTDIIQDKKVKLIKAKHKLLGYAVYMRLLEEGYRETGYFIQIDDDFNLLFSDENNIDFDVYISILNDCVEKGLFDKEIFEKYSVLTSKRMQQNYFDATDRRINVNFIEQYLLLNPNESYSEKVNVNIESLNDDILNENVNTGTQSKVDKIKEDKSRINDINSLVEFYKTLILPKFNKLTDKRKKHVNARINDYGFNIVKEVLQKASDSTFLRDNISGSWYNFDWIFNPNNFVKILEDKYHDNNYYNDWGNNGPGENNDDGLGEYEGIGFTIGNKSMS